MIDAMVAKTRVKKGELMGIRRWRHRGQDKLVLSKVWPDGTRFRRFMPNRTVAKQLEARIDYAIAMGEWRAVQKELARGDGSCLDSETNPTISEFSRDYLRYCRVNNRSPGFKEQALVAIRRLLGDVRLRDFKRRDADYFKETRLEEGKAPATVNRGLAVLRHMFTVAVEREFLDANPLTRYRMLKEVQVPLRILSYSEYRQLIDAVTEEDPVIGVYVTLLGETGMRKSEGLRLEWGHIRPQERVVLIGRAKSGKVRSVPLSDLAMESLGKLVRFLDIPQVFVDPRRKKVWSDPRDPFQHGRARVGLDWVGLHGLRHFRATQWLINGVDVNTVKELLGHAHIQTTMRYVHYVRTHAVRSVLEAQRKESDEWRRSGGDLDPQVDTNWIQSELESENREGGNGANLLKTLVPEGGVEPPRAVKPARF